MMKVLSPQAATAMIRIAGEFHAGKRALPPEILAKQKEVAVATRNAELFLLRVRAVDYGMIDEITRLRLELDTLYGELAESEAA